MTRLWLRLRSLLPLFAVVAAISLVVQATFACDGHSTLAAKTAPSIRLSDGGLNLVENHLPQFGDDAANAGMMQRLRTSFANGQKVTGADANFYLHEASEATMMGRGLGYDAAHGAALEKYGASPFSIYHPEVIQSNPGLFNNNWRAYWGLPPNP